MKGMKLFWVIGILWCLSASLKGQIGKPVDILSHNTTSHKAFDTQSQIVHGLDGDVITGWRSARKGLAYTGIFLQKLDAKGNWVWEADGVPVCPFPANQDNFQMVSDNFGGIIVVWEDSRLGADHPVIYAQRLNLRGEPLWGRGGLQLCKNPGAQRNPQLVSDNKNGFYIIWEDSRNGITEYDLYGQHIDLGGRRHWRASGMPICTSPNIQQHVAMQADSSGDLFVIWEDFRNGIYWNLYAQKLNARGDLQWVPSGLDVFAGVEENHHNPDIVPDDAGGMLFVYQKYSETTDGTDIYRGRLNGSGELLFHYATCFSQDEQLNPKIEKKGNKGLLVWEDRRHGNWDIYAQMIRLGDGILEWGINGIPVVKTEVDERSPVLISSTTYNYQVFSWLRKGGDGDYVRVQKLNNLGEKRWDERGVSICEIGGEQSEPAILPDNSGGLFCSWTDRRESGTSHIYVQHIDQSSKPVFDQKAIRLGAVHENSQAKIEGLDILAARDGYFFVVWEDFRNGKGNSDIYLQKINSAGKSMWRRGGIPVCIERGTQSLPILIEDGVGGVIIAWADKRNGRDEDVYSQRVNGYGKLLWKFNGVKVCDAPTPQSQICGVSDGEEGAFLAWVDARDLKGSGFDLYIQRVSHSGETMWTQNGKPFVNLPGLQTSPVLESDGKGGAYIAWMDFRGDHSNIYAQHVNNFGIYEWEFGGRCLVPSESHQRHPVMARNFQNDLYLVWQEGRYGDGYEKLFMQCITPSGRKVWDRSGLKVCNYMGRQSTPEIVTDNFGYFWVSWIDDRNSGVDGSGLFSQKFEIGGDNEWSSTGVMIGTGMREYGEYDIVLNKGGYLYLGWVEEDESKDGNSQICVQKIRPNGEKVLSEADGRLGVNGFKQASPAMAINSSGEICLIFANIGSISQIRVVPLR